MAGFEVTFIGRFWVTPEGKWAFKPSFQDELLFAFGKYSEIGRFSAILDMIGYDEATLSTAQCIETLRGLIGELNAEPSKLQRIHYQLVHMIQALQQLNSRTRTICFR